MGCDVTIMDNKPLIQRTFNQDAICAKECVKIPPPPGGIRLKCRRVPFKASNCNEKGRHKTI